MNGLELVDRDYSERSVKGKLKRFLWSEGFWAFAAPAVFFGYVFLSAELAKSIDGGAAGQWLCLCFIYTPAAVFWWHMGADGMDVPSGVIVLQIICMALLYAYTGYLLFT